MTDKRCPECGSDRVEADTDVLAKVLGQAVRHCWCRACQHCWDYLVGKKLSKREQERLAFFLLTGQSSG